MIENQGNKPKPYKIILVGSQAVGKSSLLHRIIESKFDLNYTPTIGVDFKTISVPVGQKHVMLQIWDTAGQQKFKSLTQTYFRGSKGCICVFDINDSQSLSRAEEYIRQAFEFKIQPDCIFLLANKSDQANSKSKQAEGRELANKMDINFMRVSAKTGESINELIGNMASKIDQAYRQNQQSSQQNQQNRRPRIRIDDNQGRGRCGC